MRKKKAEVPVTPRDASDLELFQAEHGAEWQRITATPAFLAGLQLLNVRALNEITSLSNEDIEKHGLLVLSGLIGLLKHEYNLCNLHKEPTFRFPVDEETVYVSPEEQAEHEKIREKFTDQQTRARYGS